jgi:hypothetical protein
MTLFTVTPATRRGATSTRPEEHDLPGFAVAYIPDGSEVEWYSDRESAETLATRCNGLYDSEADVIRCAVCSAVVTSGDPARYPYCRTCHYIGAAEEDVRAEQVTRFAFAFPDARVGIDHTGGGCFWLSIRWADSPTYYTLTNGEASLPTDADGRAVRGGWGYVGRYNDSDGHEDYEGWALAENGDALENPSQGMTDAHVIEVIRADIAARGTFTG